MSLNYTDFLECQNQIQKIYNCKAKEEREIIYGVEVKLDVIQPKKLFADSDEISSSRTNTEVFTQRSNTRQMSITSARNSLPNSIQLVLLNKAKDKFYIEIAKINNINADIQFKYSTNLASISKIQYVHKIINDNDDDNENKENKVNNDNGIEINECVIKAEKDYNIKFFSEKNLKEFVWCLIHIIELLKLEANVAIKSVNYKDLEDYAEKNSFKKFNPIFDKIKKKSKYQVEATDKELNTLHSTLQELGVTSIISYDLEHLNSKIDQFSIEKKEFFLKQLQGDFKDSVNKFLLQLGSIDTKVELMMKTCEEDTANVNSLNAGIQKIEDKNHRIELRNQNKTKLKDYMHNLIEQLTISPSKRETLLTTQYIATSELVIVGEVLDNFVNFYKNRKKQDIDMDIIKEGQEQIRGIITNLIKNFNVNVYEYIKSTQFNESNLFRNLPTFKNQELKKFVEDNKIDKQSSSLNRISLQNYLLDRKFVVQKLNNLFNNQEDLNEIDAFSLCRTSLAKGMRDTFANEFNNMVEMWEIFFQSDLLDEKKYNLYLDSDTFLHYDAFTKLYSDPIYEANKFFSCCILNTFFNCDIYIDDLLSYFNESPVFNLEKSSKNYSEIESIVSRKVYDSMSKNFESSYERSILLAFVIYAILSAVQEKLSVNLIGDYVQISIKDIFEARKKEEDMTMMQYDNVMDEENVYDLEEIGVYKISSQETKNFIANNIKMLKNHIYEFINEQLEIIGQFTCEIRRVGIIPIVKKAINFLKLLLAITNGVKNESIYEIFEDFKVKLKLQIEKIANTDKKYTNIVLVENYHYILRFFKSFDEVGLNVDNPKFIQFEEEFDTIFNQYKDNYIKEIFDYQFHDFYVYFNNFQSQYQVNKEQIKVQNTFTVQQFDKKVNAFVKDLNKEIDTMAKRVLKHFCKEEGLGPSIWNEEKVYFSGFLYDIEKAYKDVYNKQFDVKSYIQMLTNYNFKALYDNKK